MLLIAICRAYGVLENMRVHTLFTLRMSFFYDALKDGEERHTSRYY